MVFPPSGATTVPALALGGKQMPENITHGNDFTESKTQTNPVINDYISLASVPRVRVIE